MSGAAVSRGARRFVLAGAGFLVAWQAGVAVGLPRRPAIVLGLFGFVLHTVFGKAYSLVPSYFDRELAVPRAPAIQFPLSLVGTVGLALGTWRGPRVLAAFGGVAWLAGVAVFLGVLLATIGDNLTGAATGTSEANADRRPVDRLANGFVPVALAYLAVGSYETAATYAALPTLLDGYVPRITHLLAAGFVAVLVFAIGFRLLPRFLVASPPLPLVAVVLPAGALGPVLVAVSLPAGPTFVLGAALETIAVVGFAAGFVALLGRSDRDRVGFYGVLVGVSSAVLAALLGLSFALDAVRPALVAAHRRLTLLGFLGTTIVGVAYQFYPPSIGTFPLAGDRTALGSIACLGGGLLVEVVGLAARSPPVATAGRAAALVGALGYAYLLTGLFYQRYYR